LPWSVAATPGSGEWSAASVPEAPQSPGPTWVPSDPATLPWAPEFTGGPADPPRSSYPPLFGGPTPKPSRRTWLWATVIVLVLLAGTGGFVAWRVVLSGPGKVQGAPSNRATNSSQPVPTDTPLRPGLEPPNPGPWPRLWPKFVSDHDKVSTLSLDGLGFKLTVPVPWQCALRGSGTGYVRYNCGADTSTGQRIGGDVIERDCPQPCDAQQQTTMRATEEAWGLQWREAGPNVTIAETTKLNGAATYALVLIGYWHSTPGGPLDRQIVLRMTGPPDWVNDIRKFANAVRDSVAF
jgi:hypothetical protein